MVGGPSVHVAVGQEDRLVVQVAKPDAVRLEARDGPSRRMVKWSWYMG